MTRRGFLAVFMALVFCALTVVESSAAAFAQQQGSNVQTISYKALFDVATNPLGWQKYAGQTVGVYGGQFFNIARISNGGYLISLRSGPYSTDVLSCSISKDSMDTAATFKPGDPVSVIGKLAGSPHDNRPAFDGDCYVASGRRAAGAAPAADTNADSAGPSAPAVTVVLQQYFDEEQRNSVAFEQKYLGKVVQISGGKVGDIHPNYFEVTLMIGAPSARRESPIVNCFVSPAGAAGLASLSKGQKIKVTGLQKKGDLMKALNGAPLLTNCSYQ